MSELDEKYATPAHHIHSLRRQLTSENELVCALDSILEECIDLLVKTHGEPTADGEESDAHRTITDARLVLAKVRA